MSYQTYFNFFSIPTNTPSNSPPLLSTPTPTPNEINPQPHPDFQETIFMTEDPTPPIRSPTPPPQANEGDFRTNQANFDFLLLNGDILNTDNFLAQPINNPTSGYFDPEPTPNDFHPSGRNLFRGGQVFTINETENLIDEEALFNDVMGPARNPTPTPLMHPPIQNAVMGPARNTTTPNPPKPFIIKKNFKAPTPKISRQQQKNYARYIVRQIIRYLVSQTLKWKTEELCEEWGRSYEDTKRYYLDNIESFTSIAIIKEHWAQDPVFREFSRWFLKEKAIRYIINEGKMRKNTLNYIRFKNRVLRTWLHPE